jgi:hypothetical protein
MLILAACATKKIRLYICILCNYLHRTICLRVKHSMCAFCIFHCAITWFVTSFWPNYFEICCLNNCQLPWKKVEKRDWKEQKFDCSVRACEHWPAGSCFLTSAANLQERQGSHMTKAAFTYAWKLSCGSEAASARDSNELKTSFP